MADNVIDTLSIDINSSSKGVKSTIDSVITHLARLNGALENYADDSSKYGRAMANLSDGLERLNSTISKLDTKNLQSVAKSISSLSASANKLNGAFGNTGMDKATKDAMALDNEVEKAVQDIMTQFGVLGSAGDSIRDSLKEALTGVTITDAGAIKLDPSIWNSAMGDLARTIELNIQEPLAKGGVKGYDSVLDYIRGHKIALPFNWKEVQGDYGSFKSMAASIFGVGNVAFGAKEGFMAFDSLVQELDDHLKTSFQDENASNSFLRLYEHVMDARRSMEEFEDTTMSAGPPIEEINQAITDLSTRMLNFKHSLATKNDEEVNPFERLASGLRQLEGITIPDVSGIAMLAENVGKLSNKRAMAGIQNLPQLVQGLQGLRSLDGMSFNMDLTGLAKLIETLSTLGYKKANSATTNLQPIITGLTQLSAMTGMPFPDPEPIRALANAISTMGRQSTATAIQNMPQLAEAFRNFINELARVPQVSNSTVRLAEALARLSANGARAGAASRSLQGSLRALQGTANPMTGTFKSLGSTIANFGKKLLATVRHSDNAASRYNTLASKVGLLYAKYWALMRIINIFNRITGAASSLIEVQNVVDTTFGAMSQKVEDFSKNAIKNFGLSELSAKQTASRFQAMGTAMGITSQQVQKAQGFLNMRKTLEGNVVGYDKMTNSMADMSINLTKLSADMASFYDVEQETVQKALASGVMAGQTRPLILAA